MTELTKSEVSTSLSPTPKSFLLIRGFLERDLESFNQLVNELREDDITIVDVMENIRTFTCECDNKKIQKIRERRDIYYLTEVVKEESKEEKRKRLRKES